MHALSRPDRTSFVDLKAKIHNIDRILFAIFHDLSLGPENLTDDYFLVNTIANLFGKVKGASISAETTLNLFNVNRKLADGYFDHTDHVHTFQL